MLRLREVPELSEETTNTLAELQAEVDAASGYAAQTEAAKARWQSTSKATAAFVEVKEKLVAMCSGHRRCAYCEDSVADEIEHFRPKDLYPDHVFRWENYLYSCGPCNSPKSNHFAVLESDDPELTDVTRARRDTIVPPPPGEPAFLDPRVDDPLDFLVLDIVDTFTFRARPRISARKKLRANYTIKELHLNDRAYLVEGRKTSYYSLLCALDAAAMHKSRGEALDGPKCVIEGTPHRCVWEEMKRQAKKLPLLMSRFNAVPEVLAW